MISLTPSYLTVTQAPSTVTLNTNISTPSTTVASTSDWTNDGSGKYTYTGSIPQRFTLQLDLRLNSLSLLAPFPGIIIIKNDIFSSIQTQEFALGSWQISSSGNNISISQSTLSFTMTNGDYITLRWIGRNGNPLTKIINISIRNVIK